MATAYCSASDVYRVTGVPSEADGGPFTDAVVTAHITSAQALIDEFLGTTYEPGGTSVSQTLDGNGTDKLYLDLYPIQSVESLSIGGTSVTTTKIFVYKEEGYIVLKDTAEVTTFLNTTNQQVAITYKYGEVADGGSIPTDITLFCATVAGMMLLIAQIGGTFDDVTSYNIPEFSASKGEPYTNIREALARLEKQMNMYLRLYQKKPFFYTG